MSEAFTKEDRLEILEALTFQIEETQTAIDHIFDQAVCFSQQAALKVLVARRKHLEGVRARAQNHLKVKP